MSDGEWKCSGCGIESPGQLRSCSCVTNVLFKRGNKHTWKLDAPEVEAIAKAIKLLESQGYTVVANKQAMIEAAERAVMKYPYFTAREATAIAEAVVAACRDKIMVPTRQCMNLAATVNVVLYDRLAKQAASVVPFAESKSE